MRLSPRKPAIPRHSIIAQSPDLYENRGCMNLEAQSLCLAAVAALLPCAAAVPDWALGPFLRPSSANPVIAPNQDSLFLCPILREPVHWEALHTFNPAAVVRNGK